MADKFVFVGAAGQLTEKEAPQVSTGAPDAGKIPALDVNGRLDSSMMPTGIAADTQVLVASEALAGTDFVNVWNDAGTPKARKADATTAGKEAMGFVKAAVVSGGNATVFFEGTQTGLTGLTAGPVFLSTTPGLATNTPPSAVGNLVQRIGYATSATTVNFNAGVSVVKA